MSADKETQLTPADAAATVYNDLNIAEYTVEQKIQIVKEMQGLIRSEIDMTVQNLNALRSTF